MKSLFFLLCLVLLTGACQNGEKKSAQQPNSDSTRADHMESDGGAAVSRTDTLSSDRIITPGTGIGQTFLEETPDTLIAILGKPDYQDAAMGKAWLSWLGKKRDEHNNQTGLDVFLTYQDSSMTHKVVRQIRTTSSWFRLQDTLHVYASFSSIKNAFPAIKYSGQYKDGNRQFKIYDDLAQGVAFEMVTAAGQTLCTAILVHVPGKPLTAVYFPMHDGR